MCCRVVNHSQHRGLCWASCPAQHHRDGGFSQCDVHLQQLLCADGWDWWDCCNDGSSGDGEEGYGMDDESSNGMSEGWPGLVSCSSCSSSECDCGGDESGDETSDGILGLMSGCSNCSTDSESDFEVGLKLNQMGGGKRGRTPSLMKTPEGVTKSAKSMPPSGRHYNTR